MVDVQALIAAAKKELESGVVHDLPAAVGGENVTLGFEKLPPDEWDLLVGENPPRQSVENDALLGYNPKGVSQNYPRVQLDGELLDAGTWAELYSVMGSVARNAVELTIWGININDQLAAMRAAGKAYAGRKSDSPAN